MIPFLYTCFELYWLVYFVFAIQDFGNLIQWGSPIKICFRLPNQLLYAKDDAFKVANIDILFLRKIC